MTSFVQDISAPTALSNPSQNQASSTANNNNDANTLSILVKCERNLVNSSTSDTNRINNNEEINYIDSKSSNGSILFL